MKNWKKWRKGDVRINYKNLKDDREKVEEVVPKVLDVDVPIFSVKRIGKKGQGNENRLR